VRHDQPFPRPSGFRLGEPFPSPLVVALPTTSVSDAEARKILKLEADEEARIKRKVQRPFPVISEMISNVTLHRMLAAAANIDPTRDVTAPTKIDAMLLAGLFSLTEWSRAKRVTVLETEFFALEENLVAASLDQYGCVIRKKTQADIAHKIGVSLATLERGIRFLKRADVVVATEPEGIYFNPFVIWRGAYEHRMAAIEVLVDEGYVLPPPLIVIREES
jgi:hypothetical protein